MGEYVHHRSLRTSLRKSTSPSRLPSSVAPNGLAVLAKLPGLLDSIEKSTMDRFLTCSAVEEDKRVLLDMPVKTPPNGHRTILVRRAALHKAIVDFAVKSGVEIRWNNKLVDLEQYEDSVTVKFDNGLEDTASFVVGCDGLHSNTRICLFGEQKADYTGLVQVGDVCIYNQITQPLFCSFCRSAESLLRRNV